MKWTAALLGTNRVLPMLLRVEAREVSAYAADPEARLRRPITGGGSVMPDPTGGGFVGTADDPKDALPTTGRLVYRDGSPAANVLLNLVACHAFETKRFRNGDYTPKTIFLVTQHRVTTTTKDGAFTFLPEKCMGVG